MICSILPSHIVATTHRIIKQHNPRINHPTRHGSRSRGGPPLRLARPDKVCNHDRLVCCCRCSKKTSLCSTRSWSVRKLESVSPILKCTCPVFCCSLLSLHENPLHRLVPHTFCYFCYFFNIRSDLVTTCNHSDRAYTPQVHTSHNTTAPWHATLNQTTTSYCESCPRQSQSMLTGSPWQVSQRALQDDPTTERESDLLLVMGCSPL